MQTQETVMNANPTRHPEIETTLLPDGHVVLVSPKTEWAQTLTPLGALVWEFCDGENTIDQIVESIGAIPEITVTQSLKDEVVKLVDDLTEAGFLLD
jgi:hypothetical protein